jgi:hypothetical protein
LGASFFFTKGGGDVSHVGKFVTSIAVQLARNVPAARQHICRAIAERPDISEQSLRDQWHHLVLGPLSALDDSGDINCLNLVIDALDECYDDNDIRVVIGLLAEARELSAPRLRIFLTSRPEVAIRHGLCHMPDALHRSFVLHCISPAIVDSDIQRFLEHNLKIIAREQCLPASWPGPETVANMVQRASGLFIWAATANRFIQQGRRFAKGRLDSIIRNDGDTQVQPERHLDNIYITVLQESIRPEYTPEEKEEHCRMLRYILGSLVVLGSPLTAQSLGELLGIPEQDIRSFVEDLHAILDVPTDETRPLRLHHPSLRDFLLDKNRCIDANFWVDEADAHNALATRCITVMTSVFEQNEENIRNLALVTSFDLLPMITRLGDQIEESARKLESQEDNRLAIQTELDLIKDASFEINGEFRSRARYNKTEKALFPPELQYACCSWAQHLKKSGKKPIDYGQPHTFFQQHFVDWNRILFHFWENDAWSLNMTTLEACVSVSLLLSSQVQLLIISRKMMLPNFTRYFRREERTWSGPGIKAS